jgi:hypothetical protein
MSVHKKLMQARLELQAKDLKKSGQNKFAGYQYFELGDFLPVVQKIFADIGLCGVVSYSADVASLSIYDIEGGDPVIITSPMGSAALKGCHEVQNIGAVETYQRRYLWVTAMEIVEHDALDATTGSAPAGSAAAIKQDAYSSLDAEAKTWIDNLALEVVTILNTEDAEQANAHIAESLGDAGNIIELKTALWHRLDSKTRTALKKKGV